MKDYFADFFRFLGSAEFSKPYSEEEHQEEALLSVFTT